MKFFAGVLLFLSLTTQSQAAVWNSDKNWDAQWEKAYQQWLDKKTNRNIFADKNLSDGRPNPYYSLRRDCADVVYTLRAIFAFENKLPYAINDPTGGDNLITNNMSRWDWKFYSEARKFKEFLIFLGEVASTRSMPDDTYPVSLNSNSVRPGTILLTTKLNHHSWTIVSLSASGEPRLLFNSIEASKQNYFLKERYTWPNPEWVYEGDRVLQENAGFRFWRPKDFLKKPVWTVPGYSSEQYNVSVKQIFETLKSRIATMQEAPNDQLRRLLADACEGLRERVEVVQVGAQAFNKLLVSGRPAPVCMNQEQYDSYSTPSRDQRLFYELIVLRNSYQKIHNEGRVQELKPDTYAIVSKIFPSIESTVADESTFMPLSVLDQNSYCSTTYYKNNKIDMAEAKRRLFLGWMSNNPNDDVASRWGEVEPSANARSNQCPNWGVWKPDLSLIPNSP